MIFSAALEKRGNFAVIAKMQAGAQKKSGKASDIPEKDASVVLNSFFQFRFKGR
jgi:hypothetical protein